MPDRCLILFRSALAPRAALRAPQLLAPLFSRSAFHQRIGECVELADRVSVIAWPRFCASRYAIFFGDRTGQDLITGLFHVRAYRRFFAFAEHPTNGDDQPTFKDASFTSSWKVRTARPPSHRRSDQSVGRPGGMLGDINGAAVRCPRGGRIIRSSTSALAARASAKLRYRTPRTSPFSPASFTFA